MRIGYARVSTDDQNLDLQRDALKQAHIEKSYEDKASGKNLDRPGMSHVTSAMPSPSTSKVKFSSAIDLSLHSLAALVRRI